MRHAVALSFLWVGSFALLCGGSGANAVTLSVVSDQSVYQIGETITLEIDGDAEGAAGLAAYARLLLGGSAGATVISAERFICVPGPCVPGWTEGPLQIGPGFADVISALAGIDPVPPQPFRSRVLLSADAPGILTALFDTAPGPNQLNFFGLTSAPGLSVTIVPEPTTLPLLSLGLLGLGVGRHSRR